jgi:hypothetical protein
MTLRLTNRRAIEPRDADPAWAAYAAALKNDGAPAPPGDKTAVAQADLGGVDLAQLVACVKECVGATVSGDDVTSGAVADGDDEAAEMFAMPIEWFDVVGDGGEARFQLWLYHADCGSLFEAGTVRSAGGFIQTYFEGDLAETDKAALTEAKAEAEGRYPDSSLRSYQI